MLYQYIRFYINKQTGILILNRPGILNALCLDFFHEMDLLLGEIKLNREINVLVITGAGKAFSAGGDISEMVGMNPETARRSSRLVQASFNRIENMEIPVIAAVNGCAIGGGCELAMACDFRIASTEAVFGLPEVNMGVIPGGGGSQRLPRHIGLSAALAELLKKKRENGSQAFVC
jgi:enoyl-CoA hydratase